MEITTAPEPYRHWIIDNTVPIVKAVTDCIPDASWSGWVRYSNELERKRTVQPSAHYTNMLPLLTLARDLTRWPWLAFLTHLTGIHNLIADEEQYGAGLHVSDPGDYLQQHLDYSVHPQTGLERRLNLILYLNDCEGGCTELWDRSARNVVRTVRPKAGRLLLWEAGETAYHGAACVEGSTPRITLATYYYTDPRPGCSPRQRALFVPRR